MNFAGVTNIDELIKKENPQNMIEEMVTFFKDRTKKHIELVQKYCQKIYDYDKKRFTDILDRGKEHDQSKYREPEMAPYILITWEYHCKDLGKECKLSKKSRDEMNEATEHHIKNNAHHPEFHSNSTNESTINRENREAIPDKMVDATKMSDLDIGEMCADWAAMGEERGSTPKEWANKNVNKRWKFTEEQERLIYDLIQAIWA